MAGQIIISNIKTDSDNAFSILANTGAVLFSANLASGITTGIADGSITGNKIGLTAINANNIVNGTITGSKIALGTITGDDIATGQITGNLIATNAISQNNIVSVNASVATVGTLPTARLPAGSVLQVVSANLTTLVTASSDTWTNILSASITPTNSANKILVMYSTNSATFPNETVTRLLRGATTLPTYSGGDVSYVGMTMGSQSPTNYGWSGQNFSMQFLDSPATTSATTYTLQGYQNGASLIFNRSGGTSSGDSQGGITTLTLMEVAG